MKKELVSIEAVQNATKVLRAVNHSLRQDIINLLDIHKKLTVTDIYGRLRIEQSIASQHLAILRKEGIVGIRRDGKLRYYYVIESRLIEINEYAKALAGKN